MKQRMSKKEKLDVPKRVAKIQYDAFTKLEKLKDIEEFPSFLKKEISIIHQHVRDKNYLGLKDCLDKASFEIIRLVMYEVEIENNMTVMEYSVEVNWNQGLDIMIHHCMDIIDSQIATVNHLSSLHLAVLMNLSEPIILFLTNSTPVDILDVKGLAPLHYACDTGNLPLTKLLQSQGANINAKSFQEETPLHMAATKGHTEIVLFLIQEGANINPTDFKDQVRTFRGERKSRSKHTDDKVFEFPFSPLHQAIIFGHNATADILIQAGATVDPTAIYLMIEKMPHLLGRHLDMTVSAHNFKSEAGDHAVDFHNTSFCLKINFSSLMLYIPQKNLKDKRNNCSEMFLLTRLVNKSPASLLHPVCQTLIQLKWMKMKSLVYLYSLTQILFLLIYSTYIFLYLENIDLNLNVWLPQHLVKFSEIPDLLFVWIILLALVLFILFIESMRYSFNPKVIIFNLEHVIDTFITAALPFMIPIFENREPWETTLCAILIIAISSKFMYILGKFPSFSLFIMLFQKVSSTMSKIFFIYMWILIGFAFAYFIILLPSETVRNHSIIAHTLRTAAMTMGEIEVDHLFIEPQHIYKVGSALLFVLFVFVVHIVMVNIMVGMPLYDIHRLMQEGQILWLSYVVRLLQEFESIILYTRLGFGPLVRRMMVFDNKSWNVNIYPNVGNVGQMQWYEKRQSFTTILIKNELHQSPTSYSSEVFTTTLIAQLKEIVVRNTLKQKLVDRRQHVGASRAREETNSPDPPGTSPKYSYRFGKSVWEPFSSSPNFLSTGSKSEENRKGSVSPSLSRQERWVSTSDTSKQLLLNSIKVEFQHANEQLLNMFQKTYKKMLNDHYQVE